MSEFVEFYHAWRDFSDAVMGVTDSFLFMLVGLFMFAWGYGLIEVRRRRR